MTKTVYVVARTEEDACRFASIGASHITWSEANEQIFGMLDFEQYNIYEVEITFSAYLPGER